MIAPGQTIQDKDGRSYRVHTELGSGGQGAAFLVEEVTAQRRFIAKVLTQEFATPAEEKRLKALLRLKLPTRSPAFCAPMTRLAPECGVGSIQPFAPGVALSTLLDQSVLGLLDALTVALVLSQAVAMLDTIGVAHGDLAPSNVIVDRQPDHFEVYLIDFENAALKGAPAPACRGQDYYCAPEVLAGTAPAITSDRFALAAVLHELLLGRHHFVAIGRPLSFEEYKALLNQHGWLEDPAVASITSSQDGRPVAALSRVLQNLFRDALQPLPMRRPPAAAWATALLDALGEVYRCSRCGLEMVNEPTRFQCVSCGRAAEALTLVLPGHAITFETLVRAVGRADLGEDMSISRRHAVFSRAGYALRVKVESPNGLGILRDGVWRLLGPGDESTVVEGDRLRFAPSVEGVIVPSLL